MSMSSSGGLEEGAAALLTETARAEAMLQILVQLSNSPEFKTKLAEENPVSPRLIEKLVEDILHQTGESLRRLLPQVVREAVEMVRDGLRSKQRG